ncbi:MAG: hypothetical protein ACREBU_23160 [Nitrososphaera sp.]
MPLTCAVCRKKINSVAELADHISDTSNREETEWIFDDMMELINNPEESERQSEISRGFSHVRYYDTNGELLPHITMTAFYVPMMAGAKWCIECREKFPNNYRMYKHYVDTLHGLDYNRPERARENLEYMEESLSKWF